MNITNDLVYTLNLKYHYDSRKVINRLKEIERLDYYDEIIETCHEQGFSFLHPFYPRQLLSLYAPPTFLFYEGNPELLKMPSIGIIGSRANSEYGKIVTGDLIKRIPKEYTIVSGLALGIDGIAHQKAIETHHKTIAVIGSGLSHVYPKENKFLYDIIRKDHLLISEYCYDEPVMKHHFLERNRIIAGLSDILIVIESTLHSGTSSTVKEMLALGKDVFVIPHNIYNLNGQGNLKMLEDGAQLLWNFDDFEELLKKHLTNSKNSLR